MENINGLDPNYFKDKESNKSKVDSARLKQDQPPQRSKNENGKKAPRILHTADTHLRDKNSQPYKDRWEYFKRIMELGKKQNIDLMLISGDLLDKNAGSGTILDDLGELFSKYDYRIVIIRGNHDRSSLDNLGWGENVIIIEDYSRPAVFRDLGLAVWGLPFERNLKDYEIVARIRKMDGLAKDGKDFRDLTHILLFHGDLISESVDQDSILEDDGYQTYMPVKRSYFKNSVFRYILAGHIHSKFQSFNFNGGRTTFVYPGSPYPIKKKELGPRHVNLFTLGEAPSGYELNTPFFSRVNIKLSPDIADFDALLKSNPELERLLQKNNARIGLSVKGFVNLRKWKMNAAEFERGLKNYINDAASGTINFGKISVRDIAVILEDPLYIRLREKIAGIFGGEEARGDDKMKDIMEVPDNADTADIDIDENPEGETDDSSGEIPEDLLDLLRDIFLEVYSR